MHWKKEHNAVSEARLGGCRTHELTWGNPWPALRGACLLTAERGRSVAVLGCE